MIYHIVTGDLAAAPLKEAIIAEPSMAGEVIVIKDVLSVGPLKKEEGQKFSELRSAFWQQIVINEKNPVQVDDMERLLETSLEVSKNEDARIWVWIAPWPADICTYYWVLKYLGKYPTRFYVVNIAGLPFLDEPGAVDGLLSLPFGAAKTAEQDFWALHQPGIGGKNQIGQAFPRRQQADRGVALDGFLELGPLPHRLFGVGARGLPRHPGIDDIGHAEKVGRAHQDAFWGGVGQGALSLALAPV